MQKRNKRQKKKLTIPSIILLLIIITISTLMMEEEPQEQGPGQEVSGNEDLEYRVEVTVSEFIDGDTTRFNYNGSSESFRYLIIDTPETKHSRYGEEPYGEEAAKRTKELLANAKTIEVEFDEGPNQDDYDRYLAYVYTDGEMINETLVREGLAEVKYVNPPNDSHVDILNAAQKEAQRKNIGIWSDNK